MKSKASGVAFYWARLRVVRPALALFATFLISSAAWADKALILDTTVSGGAGSREALAAVAAGLTVDVVNAATWGGMTTPQFAAYRVIVLGDPTCSGSESSVAAAIANAATWNAAVNGNVIVIGTDPTFHAGSQAGAATLISNGVAFAAAQVGKTGLYAALSCYYASSPVTPITWLSGLGTFTTEAAPGCFNNSHIVASHPALSGLTDANLSNWSCSVHEILDSWPPSFLPLAVALGVGSYKNVDGTTGQPYIVASGAGLVAGGGCPEHSIHGHIDTNPPGHYAGIASHVHQDQHGHHIPLVNGCPPTHAFGHTLGLTADEPDFVAALNQEGKSAPARRGTVLQLFGSAAGLYLGTADDNQPADLFTADASGSPLYFTTTLPRVRIGGLDARVLFSGLAPGLQGAWQINVEIPEQVPAGELPVTITYEGFELRSVDIAVK